MIIKKKAETYNTYTLEVSWGQLVAFREALEADHADPVRDETAAELAWYMDRIPGPGEDEKEIEAQQKAAEGGGEPGAVEGEDLPIPMPPDQGAGTEPGGEGEEVGPPSEEEMGTAEGGEPTGGEPTGGEPASPQDVERGLPEPESEPELGPVGRVGRARSRLRGERPGETDRRLPEPPSE